MLAGVGNFLKSYAEGLLQQQYGPDFRSKQAAAALEPERIRTGIEAQRTGIEATKSGMRSQALQQQQIEADLQDRKDKIAALKTKGIISAEAEKLLLDKAHTEAQIKLTEANAAESGARKGEHEARAGLYKAQGGYFSRRPGVPNRPVVRSRQVPTDVRQRVEDAATKDLTKGSGLFSRINWGNLFSRGQYGPGVTPLKPEQDPSTVEFAKARGQRIAERLKAEGYDPGALAEVSGVAPQPQAPSPSPGPSAGGAPQIGFDPSSGSYFMVVGGRRIPISQNALGMSGVPPVDEGYEP
jgi:hypothetical protein